LFEHQCFAYLVTLLSIYLLYYNNRTVCLRTVVWLLRAVQANMHGQGTQAARVSHSSWKRC